jgi:hypothetical protein
MILPGPAAASIAPLAPATSDFPQPLLGASAPPRGHPHRSTTPATHFFNELLACHVK